MLGVTMTTRCMCRALCSCAISSGSAASGVYTRAGDIGNSDCEPWMCVWQSQAPDGTSKFTCVAGCDALANASREANAAAMAPTRISRLLGMPPPLELVAAQAPVDRNDRAGDIARPRRGEETHQVRDVLGLAVLADRDLLLALLLAELRRVVAQDLLGHDAARRHRVDGDAVLADLARQALGP